LRLAQHLAQSFSCILHHIMDLGSSNILETTQHDHSIATPRRTSTRSSI
jgi:hypothetical protein